ncbi:MAG: type II toxin-antitoxin system VapB family antitoxin [Anaerolineales bacterium]|nr:type II toxin-antitoxin system VapB family antitoxin [Anaerolineales bacterium]
MRTTIRLDDQLLAEIKQLANQSEKTMTAIIEEALRLMIAQRKQSAKRTPIKLITFDGNGLQAGVDLDDSAALLDLMEQANDPA